MLKAAAAIEALQAEVEILKVSGREACFEGLAADAEPKHGEWIRKDAELYYWHECSKCGERPLCRSPQDISPCFFQRNHI